MSFRARRRPKRGPFWRAFKAMRGDLAEDILHLTTQHLTLVLSAMAIAIVTTIGTATIAAAIGGGGLGVFIFRGINSVDTVQILAGAIPSAALALLADGGLGWIERKLSPV